MLRGWDLWHSEFMIKSAMRPMGVAVVPKTFFRIYSCSNGEAACLRQAAEDEIIK
jgi:hypothetical protein